MRSQEKKLGKKTLRHFLFGWVLPSDSWTAIINALKNSPHDFTVITCPLSNGIEPRILSNPKVIFIDLSPLHEPYHHFDLVWLLRNHEKMMKLKKFLNLGIWAWEVRKMKPFSLIQVFRIVDFVVSPISLF